MTDIGGNTYLSAAAQTGAAVATGGLSLPAQVGIQAAIVLGSTLLSRSFDQKAVLSKSRRISDPASTEWNRNPLARSPIGDWVVDGGTVMAAFCKTNKNESKVSTRCDVVIALADYDLPDPQLRIGVRTRPDAPISRDGLTMFVAGRREVLLRQVEKGKALGDVVTRDSEGNDPLTRYTVRYHYEPRAGSLHEGSIRAYFNRASQANDVRWQELRAYLNTKPTWWNDDDDGDYEKTEFYNEAWTAAHQLVGISGIHLIMNYTSGGIDGNVHNHSDKKNTEITSFPSVSFEYNTGISGNPADVLERFVTRHWGFPASILDADQQRLAKTRCENYTTTLQGSRGDITLKPMRVASVFTDAERPMRILQMLETVSGGKISFRDNKIALVPGEYKSNTPPERHLSEKDCWAAPRVTSNIANNQRRNSVQGTLEVCLQSDRNNPVELPLVRNQHLQAQDNYLLTEHIPRIGYINDWFDAQQLMSIHNERQGQRQRLLLSVFETDQNRQWTEGTDILVNMPSIAIEGRVFIIDEVHLVQDQGLVISVYEQTEEDPFEFLRYRDLDFDPDDNILRDIETGDILVPQVSNVRRLAKKTRFNTDIIAFDVAEIDDDYIYYLETEHRIQVADGQEENDWSLLNISPKNDLTYRYSHVSFDDQVIELRMRYRTTSTRDQEGPTGEWTEIFESAPTIVAPLEVSGLSVVAITFESGEVIWYPAEYVSHKHTELRYGTGTTVGESVVGEPIVVAGPLAISHTLTDLGAETDYWVQARHVNLKDQTKDWPDASSVLFRTLNVVDIGIEEIGPFYQKSVGRPAPPAGQTTTDPPAKWSEVPPPPTATESVWKIVGSRPAGSADTVKFEFRLELYTLRTGIVEEQIAFAVTATNVAPEIDNGADAAAVRANRRNDDFLPGSEWSFSQPAFTGPPYFLWQIKRRWSSATSAWLDWNAALLINRHGKEVDPLHFEPGDTWIEVDAGGDTLTPAAPGLSPASGGDGSTLVFSTQFLPDWLEVPTDPDAALFGRVKIKTGKTAPADLYYPFANSFRWLVTDGTTTIFKSISVFVKPESTDVGTEEIGPFYQKSASRSSPPAGQTTTDPPAGWSEVPPPATQTENVWEVIGERPAGSADTVKFEFTKLELYENRKRYAPPILPVFRTPYGYYQVELDERISPAIVLPRATISSNEALEYLLTPALPDGMAFSSAGVTLSGTPTVWGTWTHSLIARVRTDHSRFAVALISGIVIPDPDAADIPDQ